MTKPIPSLPNVCKRIFLLSICILSMANIFAQVGISTTSITPNSSSILELRSSTLGFLPPRMTTTERDAIASPANGLVIYNTTTSLLNFYNGSSWQINGGGSVSSVSVTTANGISGTVTNASSTPAISLTLGAITPTSVTATGAVTGSNLSGTNTGDQNTITGNAGSATLTEITDDNITAATMYPTWVTTASGNQAQKVSSTKLSFNPSTGTLTSTAFAGNLTGDVTGNASNITEVLGAASFPALTGDVTTTAGSLVTSIAANTVTVADMAQVVTGTVLGRNTAGTGNLEVLTALPTNVTGKWTFLGTATGATVTVGPVIWTGTYKQIMINYFIAGYNGGAVGRLLFGAASISTTALTNGNTLSEGVTLTTNASVPGCPLAVTVSNIARDGWVMVDGASGSLKRFHINGQNGGSVATPPTLFRATGVFSDLGTNLPLQRVQLTVYANITNTSVSSNTFSTGTYITVWGRNND